MHTDEADARRDLLLIDTEDSKSRNDKGLTAVSEALDTVMYALLDAAGARPDHCVIAYRGDGALVAVDPRVPLPVLLRTLLVTVPDELDDHNRRTPGPPVRQRFVLHRGAVTFRKDDVLGSAVNDAFVLLGSDPLKRRLRERPEDAFALCVSQAVYDEAVRPDHKGIRRERFHQILVRSRDETLLGWLYGEKPAAAVPSHAEPWRGTTAATVTVRDIHGGDNIIGNVFHGAVHHGDAGPED
ncbi:hypothetical protein [Streptomyces purpureus]|uniref:hypothetical protein n=1 Tax=Streptomyces purpureus TaxID=1951 RepID=UPI00036879F7|nr:hypothetical protein [Streptomyces purpureus]